MQKKWYEIKRPVVEEHDFNASTGFVAFPFGHSLVAKIPEVHADRPFEAPDVADVHLEAWISA